MKKKQGSITVAVILCGGRGTRINKYTRFIPKSLIRVQKYPLIWFSVKLMLKNNVEKIIFPLGYKGGEIKKYILKKFPKNKENFYFINTGINTEIHHRIEKIKNNINKNENFFLLNSDTIYDFNLKKIIQLHLENNFLVTVSSANMRSTWGSFLVGENKNYISNFSKEDYISNFKTHKKNNFVAYRNSGLSIINKKCIEDLNYEKIDDFEVSLYNKHLRAKKVGFYHFNDFWHPVETVKDLDLTTKSINIEKTIKKLINKFS